MKLLIEFKVTGVWCSRFWCRCWLGCWLFLLGAHHEEWRHSVVGSSEHGLVPQRHVEGRRRVEEGSRLKERSLEPRSGVSKVRTSLKERRPLRNGLQDCRGSESRSSFDNSGRPGVGNWPLRLSLSSRSLGSSCGRLLSRSSGLGSLSGSSLLGCWLLGWLRSRSSRGSGLRSLCRSGS